MCDWLNNASGVKQSDDTRTSTSTLNTGGVSSDVDKNIYDLAGNVLEWTMEAYGASYRVVRGGSYRSAVSVSYRYYDDPYYSSDFVIGGRSALFIL